MRLCKPRRSGWLTLTLLMVVVAAGVPQITIISPFINELAHDLGVSVGRVGQLGSANYVGAFLACVLLIPFIERMPMKGILIWSTLVIGVTTILTAAILDFFTIFALRLIAGAASGLIMTGTLAAVGRAWSETGTRMRMTGFVVGAIGGGSGLVTPVLRIVSGLGGWQLAFYAYGGLSLFIAAMVFLLMPALPGVSQGRVPRLVNQLKQAAKAASMPVVDRTLLLAIAAWVLWIAAPVFAAGFLIAKFPGEDEWIGPMFLIVSVGFVAASFSSGPVIAKLGGPRKVLALIGVLFPVAIASFAWLVFSPMMIILGLTLVGSSFGLYVPALVAFLREHGQDHQSAVMFAYGAGQQAAAAVGATIWGVIVETTGFDGFQVWLTCGLVLPVAALIFLLMGTSKRNLVPVGERQIPASIRSQSDNVREEGTHDG